LEGRPPVIKTAIIRRRELRKNPRGGAAWTMPPPPPKKKNSEPAGPFEASLLKISNGSITFARKCQNPWLQGVRGILYGQLCIGGKPAKQPRTNDPI